MSQHGCPERLSNRSKGFQEEGAGQATMEVLVETLTGTAFEMTVSPSDTIFAIKSKIFRVEGIPVSQQHLVYNLQELEDAASLRALGIADGARLRLVLGMRGGPVSTRRLPPPPGELGGDLERLLGATGYREGSAGAGAGCKVTVLVFRDGERVNMLRVREERDGSLQPLPHADYSSSVSPPGSPLPSGGAGGARDNAVTMHKMLELRRRMDALALQRQQPAEPKAEIQKTRSEETLSVPSLLDDAAYGGYAPYSEADDAFTPLSDGRYTRYGCECSLADRYTLLPPIGARAESEQSVDRLHSVETGLMSEALSGLLARRERDGDEAAREDWLQEPPPPGSGDYGPLVGGGWRGRFGSSSALAPAPAPLAAAAHSASSLQLRAPPPPRAPPPAALYSASTSDLATLTRAMLPLSRHRNREHLHLSDDGLGAEAGSERRQRRIRKIAELEHSRLARQASCEDVQAAPAPGQPKKGARARCRLCRKRLSVAAVHTCRCGAEFCAPHRYAEVHGCAYDYKAHAQQYLQRANPLVSAPKLPKI